MPPVEWTTRPITADRFMQLCADASLDAPIEQLEQWAQLDATDPARTPVGFFEAADEHGTVRAAWRATRMADHGTRFVWLRHGPVWLSEPNAEDEERFVRALVSAIRRVDLRATHVRLSLNSEPEGARLPTSIVTYDSTVVIDTSLSDGDLDDDAALEEILSRFKARGRRDVRKAIRESGLVCADETASAATDFTPYYEVMKDTAERDGFTPWSADVYRRMVSILGQEHARVYAGRIDGEIVCWSIVCINGARAWRYYAASSSAMMRRRVTDRLIAHECVDLGRRGVVEYDLMGIGSEISESLKGLNEFKTKFSKDVRTVAPEREIVVRPLIYSRLQRARRIARSLRR